MVVCTGRYPWNLPYLEIAVGAPPALIVKQTKFIKMKHGEQTVVTFTSAIARQVAENGTTKKYYRNNFIINGQAHSVSSPDKLTGQVGRVMFVEKGQPKPGGGTVENNAFTLIGAGTLAELREAAATKAAAAELDGLI